MENKGDMEEDEAAEWVQPEFWASFTFPVSFFLN